jgi:hypothetical protein
MKTKRQKTKSKKQKQRQKNIANGIIVRGVGCGSAMLWVYIFYL